MAEQGYKQLISYKLANIAFILGWEFVPTYYKKYEDKRVFLVLKNNYKYNGKVIKVNENNLLILDKFNNNVNLAIDSIAIIEEIKNEHT